jgi:hypothetical protein
MAGGAETPNIAALPAIARLGTCESARGPDVDRHVKLLSQFAVEGSHVRPRQIGCCCHSQSHKIGSERTSVSENPTVSEHNRVTSSENRFALIRSVTASGAQSGRSKHRLRPVQDVLRDRNDLKVLTGCADFIPNSLAHQKPCHWGYEGNRTGLRVRFVLPHDTIFLHASIVAPEGHRAPEGNIVS